MTYNIKDARRGINSARVSAKPHLHNKSMSWALGWLVCAGHDNNMTPAWIEEMLYHEPFWDFRRDNPVEWMTWTNTMNGKWFSMAPKDLTAFIIEIWKEVALMQRRGLCLNNPKNTPVCVETICTYYREYGKYDTTETLYVRHAPMWRIFVFIRMCYLHPKSRSFIHCNPVNHENSFTALLFNRDILKQQED